MVLWYERTAQTNGCLKWNAWAQMSLVEGHLKWRASDDIRAPLLWRYADTSEFLFLLWKPELVVRCAYLGKEPRETREMGRKRRKDRREGEEEK